MRLTLRTMLAFLDDVLEPTDAQDLTNRIEESEFASGLVHRIRGAIGRLRLGAPNVIGKGVGLDPNSVAEYLDNTLSPNLLPEFEKVCLESDVHLAEVGACHQVLTLVLGEPATVAQVVRERAYGIGSSPGVPEPREQPDGLAQQIDELMVDVPDSGKATFASTKEVGHTRRKKPEVPDYLRASRTRRVWPLLTAVLLAFSLVLAGVYFMGPMNREHPLAWLLGLGAEPSEITDEFSNSRQEGNASTELRESSSLVADEAASPRDGRSGEERPLVDEVTDDDSSYNADLADSGGPTDPRDPVPAPGPPQGDDQPPTPLTGSASGTLVDRADSFEPIGPDAESVADSIVESEDSDTRRPFSDAFSEPADAPPEGVSVPELSGAAEETIPAQPVADIGRFISDQQVLARYESQLEDWRRLLPREPIRMDDRLLVLPSFRPQILLSTGVTLTVEGPAAFDMKPYNDGSTTEISIGYGRIVMTAVGTAEVPIALRVGQRNGVLRFSDSQTEVAVDVERLHEPGNDPSQADSHEIVKIWVIRGGISWQEEGQVIDSIGEGHVYFLVDQQAGWTELTEELPGWIHARSVKDIDRLASSTLEPSLTSDRPVTLSLRELTEDRRAEVSSLAARCLSHFDEFEPLVTTLNDERHRSFWAAHIDTFQLALARDQSTAEQVRGALERIRGQDASSLYRMLWGYSETDLRGGSDSELVDNLDHDSLDFRVLSIENLKRITGATFNYLPQHSAKRRRSSSMRWRDRQKKGLVRYEAAPVTVPRPIGGP